MAYRFGEFELDEDGRELRRRSRTARGGVARVEAAPKVLAFLRTLVGRAPAVVTRGELIESVWGGHVVSPSALNTVVKSLRQVIDDTDHRFVRTVHGIGYAFVAPVDRRVPARASALGEARERLFVGRAAELATLTAWFADPARADRPRLFWVHGVGGIGKTTLLHRVEAVAREHGVPMITASCAHVRESPEALLRAIATSLGIDSPSAVVRELAARPRGLLALDGYEHIRGIDDWVRERFVGQLPPGWHVLFSGRTAPDVRWRADPTWTRAEEIALGELSPLEADALLESRGVAASERAAIVRFAGGHPLALVLATDSIRRTGRFTEAFGGESDGVAAMLVRSFVREAPSRHHRDALDCLAVVDVLDEPLLAAMLDDDTRVAECFDWLSTLGMVERHPHGIALHELVTSTLVANLWRDAERASALVERAYTKLLAELELAGSLDRRRRLVASLWHIFDLHPALAPVLSVPGRWGTPSVAELEAIEEHVERFEGSASAAALRFWLVRDPTCARVIRDERDAMLGYTVLVKVTPDDAEARAADPVLRVLDGALDRTTKYSVSRWFADRRAYHDVTPISLACHVANAEQELSLLDEERGWHFVLVSNPEAWMPMVRVADFGERVATVPATSDGPELAVFGLNLADRSLVDWFRAYTKRVMRTLTTGASFDIGLR